MAGCVNVRAYAELNDFLGPESRGVTVRRPFRGHQTVKDILEAMGIPHTEVDLILVNGTAVDFAHRPTSGDRIAAYPVLEALDIGSTAEPLTRQDYDDFSRCPQCGRIYWPGSHRARLVSFVEGLRNQL